MSARLEAYVERFRAAAERDPRISAAFVGGSLARGTADAHADLDLYAIAPDDQYDSLFADRHALVAALGEPAVLLDFNGFGFDMVLFVLADGASGELALGRAAGFLDIHGGPHRVLVDRTGLLSGVEFPMLREEPREVLAEAVPWFWREAHEMTRALARGRLHAAAARLAAMRGHLIRVCRLSGDAPDVPLEQALPQPLLTALAGTYARLDRDELRAAGLAAAALFGQVAAPLAREHGIAYPVLAERVVRDRLS